MMTHSQTRQIEAAASQGPFQPQASSVQLPDPTRNTRGNRNASNSSDVNKSCRSTRNKTGGRRQKSEELANTHLELVPVARPACVSPYINYGSTPMPPQAT